jgi:hypothetical protein
VKGCLAWAKAGRAKTVMRRQRKRRRMRPLLGKRKSVTGFA